jgi:hypothetical protein
MDYDRGEALKARQSCHDSQSRTQSAILMMNFDSIIRLNQVKDISKKLSGYFSDPLEECPLCPVRSV